MNQLGISFYKNTVDADDDSTKYEETELIIEFSRAGADPFDNTEEETSNSPFERQNRRSKECRAQMSFYAKVWSARQHRIHCFIL